MLGTNSINVTVETSTGNVSLCLDNLGIYLCYPLSIGVCKDMVKSVLGVDEVFIKYNSAGLQITRVIEEDKMLSKIIICGGKKTNSISIPFYKEDDCVVSQLIDNVELYECFVSLMLRISKFMGDIKAINVNSDSFKNTPESLNAEGYNLTEVYRFNEKRYYAKKDNCEIILSKIYNSEKWMSTVRHKVDNDVSITKVVNLLSENV